MEDGNEISAKLAVDAWGFDKAESVLEFIGTLPEEDQKAALVAMTFEAMLKLDMLRLADTELMRESVERVSDWRRIAVMVGRLQPDVSTS
jgi:hypothetical protein